GERVRDRRGIVGADDRRHARVGGDAPGLGPVGERQDRRSRGEVLEELEVDELRARRLGEKQLVDTFIDGARDMLGVALIIGVARGITVIMNNGMITDTVLFWAEQAVSGLSSVAFIIVTYLLYLPLSFLIPSSSGLATVSMPIMAPLAEFAGVPSYLVVTAYQTANGLINLVTPTSAVVMGGLAIARVGYGVWLRFVWPLLLLLAGLSILVLAGGVLLG
ncbi:MAG TPA: hypothetical protein PKE20_10220, partial [Promineifilum sp.]|nr:hypothetical protein [Promineifilum sp.]